ncbi:N-acetyllactosaminide beta-1,3-N-acetylglucosaminyltransferase 2-like isoform X2 [Engraulis encrasicolus]
MGKSSQRFKKRLFALMMANVLVFVLVDLSMKISSSWYQGGKVRIPSERFWQKLKISDAYWNRHQQRLDHMHNPLFATSIATGNHTSNVESVTEIISWLNDTIPEHTCEPDYTVRNRVRDYEQLPQRFKDFLLYMRCRSYPMMRNEPNLCRDPPYLLLAVKTLVPHFDRRQAIRETWGRAGIVAGRKVVTVFLLGNATATDHFPDLSGMLQREAEMHRDILQWDFRDTFFNLTAKEVLFLEWLSDHCAGARYVFKGDDDVFVNTRHILNYLGRLYNTRKSHDLFIGDVITGAGPHRNQKLKYYIPESVFKGSYPPYAGGGGYLYSGEVGLRLRNVSQHVSLYPIDDVYTGMLLERLGLAPEKHRGFRTFNIDEKYRDNACVYDSLMLVHSRTPQEVIQIWSWIHNPRLNCLGMTTIPA